VCCAPQITGVTTNHTRVTLSFFQQSGNVVTTYLPPTFSNLIEIDITINGIT
jgi:hypothetical protein